MNKKSVILLLSIACLLLGCDSYRDINRTMFTTVTVIDVDEEGNPIVYMECFLSYYSQLTNSEVANRTVLAGRGETLSEAIQEINQTARQPISTSYSKILLFSVKAAKGGIDQYLDKLVRDQEFTLRTYIMLLDGDPMSFFNEDQRQGDFLGLYLEDLFESDTVSNLMRPYKLFDYMNMSTCEDHLAVMGIVTREEHEADPYLGIKEAAVLLEDKLVDTLTEDEYKMYCLLDGVSKTTLLNIPNPQDKETLVSLNIQNNKSKKSIQYDGKAGNVIHLKIELNLSLTFGETQKPIDLDDDKIRKELTEALKQKILDKGQELFLKFKTKNVDLFKVKEALYRKYPQYKMADVVSSTVLEIVVNTHLEGSANTQNYNN